MGAIFFALKVIQTSARHLINARCDRPGLVCKQRQSAKSPTRFAQKPLDFAAHQSNHVVHESQPRVRALPP